MRGVDHGAVKPDEQGSILMLCLLMCLAVAVVIQTLVTVVLCGERGLHDESTGRLRMVEKDAGLAVLRQQALASWCVLPWTTVVESPDKVEGSISEVADGSDWVMTAVVRQDAGVSRIVTSGWLERGRDGIDLPLAALVADTVTASPGRETLWMEVDGCAEASEDEGGPPAAGEAIGHVQSLPSGPLLGAGCSLCAYDGPWRLDSGWRGIDPASDVREVAEGPGTTFLTDRDGHTVELPLGSAGHAVESPVLVILTGGADLDARDLGDLYGVLVVDDGSVLLDGTVLHGAVFVTGTVDLGETGCLKFARPLLRWATDRSLTRVRLVPGSRREGTE
jgi:hypothetical protein